MKIGSQSEVRPIRSLLLKHPRDAWRNQANIDAQYQNLNYFERPDYEKAVAEYDQFINLLSIESPEIHLLPSEKNTGLDSIYTHDPVIITEAGAVLCKMGKDARMGEPEAVGSFLEKINVPILGAITGEGLLEGGDVVWLDERTLAVGEGYRTNAEGIRQLKSLTENLVDEFVVVPLPHWEGPGDVLHLMSMISPVSHDCAVVYSRMMPVTFRQRLRERGMNLIEVPDDEYDSMACNVLATAPGHCLMLSGNPQTSRKLSKAGIEVTEYSGAEISRKGAGGPTCLTRPLWRQA
ncbi:MAG: arginine deiminase family protein [candidate division Zixibacteria bacterium]|nr:arginine deiminase family protein [candidate division Zixibacteria bacterium]MDH3936746.1 arginine deiminase family protein [candidate division Zixibacteria bacterium]MDH4033777.1 arginine deiminase family protein [candidate division Zixibacteria bacterium]